MSSAASLVATWFLLLRKLPFSAAMLGTNRSWAMLAKYHGHVKEALEQAGTALGAEGCQIHELHGCTFASEGKAFKQLLLSQVPPVRMLHISL
jgi:hypothetical protein